MLPIFGLQPKNVLNQKDELCLRRRLVHSEDRRGVQLTAALVTGEPWPFERRMYGNTQNLSKNSAQLLVKTP